MFFLLHHISDNDSISTIRNFAITFRLRLEGDFRGLLSAQRELRMDFRLILRLGVASCVAMPEAYFIVDHTLGIWIDIAFRVTHSKQSVSTYSDSFILSTDNLHSAPFHKHVTEFNSKTGIFSF